MKSAWLETAQLKNDHTAENIAEELSRIYINWDILDKVSTIVTNNGANVVSAVTKYMKKIYHALHTH